MKKTLSILLSVLMALSVFGGLHLTAGALDAEIIMDGGPWGLFDSVSGTLEICGTGDMPGYLAEQSPFCRSSEIKAVVIDEGVTNVGDHVFEHCSRMTSVTFPSSLTEICDSAFQCCSSLTDVIFPAGLKSIGASAFQQCYGLTSVSIPDSVETIGDSAFLYCTSLTSVTIPKSMRNLNVAAFYACENLKTVNYPGNEAEWRSALDGGSALTGVPADLTVVYYYGVDGAIQAINDIGAVAYTAACDAKIAAARASYNRLTAAEKEQVTNYAALEAAEAAFAALQAAGNGKALQLVQNAAAANILGAQQSTIWFGNYKQSENTENNGTVIEYNVDPIQWRVLSNADGKLFLVADKNLDAMKYNETYIGLTWKTSTLRSWLNGFDATANADGVDYSGDSFLGSAFSAGEASAVAVTNVDNTSEEKVFLLSLDDIKNTAYGFVNDNGATDTRLALNTAYAAAGGHVGFSEMQPAGAANHWWLRSPGRYNSWAAFIYYDGGLPSRGVEVVAMNIAIRPALNLDLSKVLFTASPSMDAFYEYYSAGTMQEIPDYRDNIWELTILDRTRDFAVTETAATAAPGTEVTLTYSGATVGTNEYISAIVTDETGEAIYFGRLRQPSAADGTLTVALPADLATGSYGLKVFSEQYNGYMKTDLASAFCDVALTVVTQLDLDKAAAKEELAAYKNADDYRADEKAALAEAIAAGEAAIDAATDSEAVAAALANAKDVIDAIKTDAELTAEETLAAEEKLAADIAAADAVQSKIDAIG
ncbi:MAG: leucine-rich repeat domain-containing protein, partial [Clostridia bacterium]|nr:leucine-rich repeat domain-containing protein [Clostridia bacterium]